LALKRDGHQGELRWEFAGITEDDSDEGARAKRGRLVPKTVCRFSSTTIADYNL
jgi:hypothetical protein